MNEKPKVDINGSIVSAIVEAFQYVCGMVLVALLFGFLVAPMFATLIQPAVEKRYDTYNHPENYIIVAQKMVYVRAVLWGIAILGWIAVLGSYLTHPGF